MEAIIYARFSTAEQRKGASKIRQLGDCRAYCAGQGWLVVRELVDSGFSAWANKHRERGAFGELEREILNGDHEGRTLVVEHLDRLSRLDSETTLALVQSIVRAGVSIRTLNDSTTYRANEKLPTLSILTLLIGSEQNHKQSEDKSRRVRDAKAKNRELARTTNRVFTSMAPPWLTLTKDRRWKVRDDRAAIVREIFEMADAGAGKMTIARRLNERGEPCWSKSSGWHPSFVARLIRNPAVIGEFQPCERQDGKSVPAGSPIGGYYPPIIDADLFARVTGGAAARKAVRGRSSPVLNNLVSGLARCRACGSAMAFRLRAKAGAQRVAHGRTYVRGADDSALVCSSYQRKAGCQNAAPVAYATFERILLDEVLHLTLDDRAFSKDDDVRRLRTELAEVERARDQATAGAEALWRSYGAKPSDMKERMADEAEAEAAALGQRVEGIRADLMRAQGKVSDAEHLARVADVRASMDSDDPTLRYQARAKIAEAFQSVLTFIDCDVDGSVTVAVASGLAAIRITGKSVERADAIRSASSAHVISALTADGTSEKTIADVVRRSGIATDPAIPSETLKKMVAQRVWNAG